MCRQLIQEIRRSDKSIEGVTRVAERILEYFDIPEEHSTPIVFIMREIGIIPFRHALEPRELSAYIAVNPQYEERSGSNKIACVNKSDSLGHQRFALSHELAHYLFDYDEINDAIYYNTYYMTNDYDECHNEEFDSDGEVDIEYRANQFAAALLMPTRKFCRKYMEYFYKTNNLNVTANELSQFFEVPKTAVTRRIKEMFSK